MTEFDDTDDQMSSSDAKEMFGGNPKDGEIVLPNFDLMTKEETEVWEKEQYWSTDLYRIASRVKNLAQGSGGSLTPVGVILCNSHVHVLKDLYDFSAKLLEPQKTELITLLRKHENMPLNVIAASKAGIRLK